MGIKRVKVGDIIEIPLSDGRKAYGQYVFKDEKQGPLLQVFNLITKDRPELEVILNSELLFPPVFTGLMAAVHRGLWTVIGYKEVENFIYPNFIAHAHDKSVTNAPYYLWDGKEYKLLGKELPEEFNKLEQLVVWNPPMVTERIESGKIPVI